MMLILTTLLFISSAEFIQVKLDSSAKCLDGSPLGYYINQNSDSSDFVLFFEGGGWCHDNLIANKLKTKKFTCEYRSRSVHGTTSNDPDTMPDPTGILSGENSMFASWNRVYIRYCDQSGFSGIKNTKKESLFIGQGYSAFHSILESLKNEYKMSSAKNIVVTGGSAGGLATLWRCNEFQKFFPLSSIKCIADSAYFVDTKAENGRKLFFDRQLKAYMRMLRFPWRTVADLSRNDKLIVYF